MTTTVIAVLSFQYSSYVNTRISLILLLVYLSISMVCYSAVEVNVRSASYLRKIAAVRESET